jgi:type IV pilus assembly protein PilC
MPTSYAYKVRDREGKMAAGSMEAESEEAVVSRLRQPGYAPISIEAEKGAGLKTEVRLPGTGRVKLKDLAVFSRRPTARSGSSAGDDGRLGTVASRPPARR